MPVSKKTGVSKKTVPVVSRPKPAVGALDSGATVPLAIAVLLLVLGLVAGFLFHAFFFVPVMPDLPDANASVKELSFTVVKNSACAMCSDHSSFELLLAQRGVVPKPVLVTADSVEGARLDGLFSFSSFPTVVVNRSDLERVDPGLVLVLQNKFPQAFSQGFLVLPEKDLMIETKILSPYWMKDVPENVSCSVPDEKILLWEFGDNLDRASFAGLPAIQSALENHGAGLDYNFLHLALYPNSVNAAMVDACSETVGLFPQFHFKGMEMYHTQGRPIWDIIEARNIALELSSSFDRNAFRTCFEEQAPYERVRASVGLDKKLFDAYDLEQFPVFVVNCRFVVTDYRQLEESLCTQFPGLTGCEAA